MLAVDVYELSVDLAPGVRDLEFVAALDGYLTALQADGRIERWRLLRSKLGLGARSEFKVLIETRDLAQLDAAFAVVSTRAQTRSRSSITESTRSSPTFMLRCGVTFQIRKGSLGRSGSDRVRPADDDGLDSSTSRGLVRQPRRQHARPVRRADSMVAGYLPNWPRTAPARNAAFCTLT